MTGYRANLASKTPGPPSSQGEAHLSAVDGTAVDVFDVLPGDTDGREGERRIGPFWRCFAISRLCHVAHSLPWKTPTSGTSRLAGPACHTAELSADAGV